MKLSVDTGECIRCQEAETSLPSDKDKRTGNNRCHTASLSLGCDATQYQGNIALLEVCYEFVVALLCTSLQETLIGAWLPLLPCLSSCCLCSGLTFE